MAKAIGADLLSVTEAQAFPEPSWDMVGLGSGIFFGAHHKSLLRFATHWSRPPKAVLIFSTAGLPSLGWLWHRSLGKIITKHKISILYDACFPGWDTAGPLRWIGGIQRGRPNQHDLDRSTMFANSAVKVLHNLIWNL